MLLKWKLGLRDSTVSPVCKLIAELMKNSRISSSLIDERLVEVLLKELLSRRRWIDEKTVA